MTQPMSIMDFLFGIGQAILVVILGLLILLFRTPRSERLLRRRRFLYVLSAIACVVIQLMITSLLGTVLSGSPIHALTLPTILGLLLMSPFYVLGIAVFFRAISYRPS